MKIDHIAVYVEDLEAARDFFETYFAAQRGRAYHNPKTGLRTYFLSFDEGSRLELMQRPDMVKSERAVIENGYTHLSFALGSSERVDALTAELRAASYRVLSGPRTTGDGYYESCILGPEGIQIELLA